MKLLKRMIDKLEGYTVVDTAVSVADAAFLLRRNQYDILITEYEIPPMSGLELIRLTRNQYPHMHSLVLGTQDDPVLVQQSLNAGAMGFLLEKDIHRHLGQAIHLIGEDKQFISPTITERVHEDENMHALEPLFSKLETEVLKLMMQEYSCRDIAKEMQITKQEADDLCSKVWQKSGTKSIPALINYALDNGLR